MTTIACDGKTMAGDGRSCDASGTICNDEIVKVRRLKDGRIFGLAGTPYDLDKAEQWLNKGGDAPKFNEDFDLIVLERDGRVYCYDSKGDRTPEMLPAAIGSGMDIAIGAMEAGASPQEAVKIACRRNSGTGGTITALSLRQ